jgi:hypothetical protein
MTLDDLSDVDTTGVQDGSPILFDSADSTWKPGAPYGVQVKLLEAADPIPAGDGNVWIILRKA